MKTANWQLTVSFGITVGKDTITLPSGSFVKPIEYHYLPKHITRDLNESFFNKKTHVHCYTRYGIAVIPRELLRPT